MPCSRHSRASSRVSIPLMKNFPFQNLRRRSAKAQSMAGFVLRTPVMLMPSYIGRSLMEGPAAPSWQAVHGRRSLGRVRRKVSLLRPVVLSTVSAMTEHPAASTRRRSCSQASQVLGA